MSIESSIVSRLKESRDQEFMTYKGFSICSDYDNNIILKDRRGKIGEFASTEDAIEYIDSLPAHQRNQSTQRSTNPPGSKKYLIYIKDTYYDSRALFLCRKSRKCEWRYARDADQFTEKETTAILRNSKNYASLLVK